MQLGARKPRTTARILLTLIVVLVIGVGLWLALRQGPPPTVELTTDRPAVGTATTVIARFAEPAGGLGAVRLELVQGGRTEVLAERRFDRPLPLPWRRGAGEPEAVLEAVVGSSAQGWLAEGELVLRAVADRSTGPLRSAAPMVAELALAVRLRPPGLELVSSQHYARQGGAGAVVYRVGDTAVRSGVQAGEHVSVGAPSPGGGPGDRFVIYALPWDLGEGSSVRLFAEDDAGNRTERPFLDLFRPRPPGADTIELTDAFLSKVVPAIAANTPGFDGSRPLLEQYLEINGPLRRAELARVAGLAASSEPAFRWSGPFLQLANSARMAGFAEVRSYRYDGREVDRQTHLGLDLASTARAPVPAPSSGRVVLAGWMTLYGNAVVIDHGYGLMSLSGHLSSIAVSEGEEVERGQIIGSSGATGLAGGDHLHLEIFVHGQPVDPVEWLDGAWIANNITSKLEGAR
ncbi:MAG: M23 family metallopeptidase [Thermoanaerobaculales bacterium]|jgi:hypothetical protein|nr:M23 family metallopeptidase [Thermoanaerobaculales bacterium]